jgi:hypothetical protein
LTANRKELITPHALDCYRRLSPTQRESAKRALAWLRRNPEPDGIAKQKLPESFPHRPGACEAVYHGIVIAYRLTADELVIVSLQPTPDA